MGPSLWDGNRRFGVVLAVRHKLQWFIDLCAQGLSEGNECPTNISYVELRLSLNYFMLVTLSCVSTTTDIGGDGTLCVRVRTDHTFLSCDEIS